MAFYENLLQDYRTIWAEMSSGLGDIESGVKFGVSSGPVLVGFIGKNQSYFSAIGPDVNLASRLCGQARTNEMVVSSRVWSSLEPFLTEWVSSSQVYSSLKGFSYDVRAVHIQPKFLHQSTELCQTCGLNLSLGLSDEGYIEFRCPKEHPQAPPALKVPA